MPNQFESLGNLSGGSSSSAQTPEHSLLLGQAFADVVFYTQKLEGANKALREHMRGLDPQARKAVEAALEVTKPMPRLHPPHT